MTTVRRDVLDKLGVQGRSIDLRIRGVLGRQNSEKGVRAKVTLQSKNRNIEKEVELEGVADPVGDLKAFNWRELSQYWPHLKTLRFPQPVGDGEVSMIIGTNATFFHQCLREVVGESDDDPIAG